MIVTYENCCLPPQTDCTCFGSGDYPPSVLYVSVYDYEGSGFHSNPNPSALHGVTIPIIWDLANERWYGEGLDNEDRFVAFYLACSGGVEIDSAIFMDYCTAGIQSVARYNYAPDDSTLPESCDPFQRSYYLQTVGPLFENCQGDEFFSVVAVVHEGGYTWP